MKLLDRLQPWVRPATVAAMVGFVLLGGYLAALVEWAMPGAGFALVAVMAAWLDAIPDGAWGMITATVVGYFGAREAGKWADKKFAKPVKPEDIPEGDLA